MVDLVPATMISHYFEVPMHTLEIKLRDHAVKPESNKWMVPRCLDGKKILIVDDINDTGDTLAWIKQDWDNSGKVFTEEINWEAHVRFAVLTGVLKNLLIKMKIPMDSISRKNGGQYEQMERCYPWANDLEYTSQKNLKNVGSWFT